MATIFAWSPGPSELAAQQYGKEAALRDILAGVVSNQGLPWLQQSTLSTVCGVLASYGNSSLTVSATMDNASCVAGPPAKSIADAITIQLDDGPVTLWAWESTAP
jgi:hypothetical protein